MDPRTEFTKRYQEYIRQREMRLKPLQDHAAPEHVGSPSSGPKLKLGYAVFALVALSVPATMLLLNQTQDIRQRASGPDNVVPQGAVKQVGATYITASDIDFRLQILYGTNSAKFKDDFSIRQFILDQLIREKIIQQEAAKYNIRVTDSEINDKAHELGITLSFDKTKVFNMVLEDKLKNKVVAWRELDYLIAYKEAAYNSPSVVGIKKILSVVKSDIDNGKTMKEAWTNSRDSSSTLGKTISLISQAKVYHDSFAQRLSNKIFSVKVGQTTEVLDSGGGVFVLAKILDSNNSAYNTFDDWYKAVRQTYIK